MVHTNKYKRKLAYWLVWLANRLMKSSEQEMKYEHWPKFRPVDEDIKREGSFNGHEFACGAYSYEGLKSLVEQDGPDGFGARATIKWLIGEEGWKKIEDMDPREVRREFAKIGVDMDDGDGELQ